MPDPLCHSEMEVLFCFVFSVVIGKLVVALFKKKVSHFSPLSKTMDQKSQVTNTDTRKNTSLLGFVDIV